MTKQQSEAVGTLKIKSSNDYKVSNDDNTAVISFIAFCGAFVEHLNVGLSIEQQICLQEECLQMANYYEDWTLMVSSRIRLVVLNNILSKYDESLLILKELFSECDDDSYQSTMYILFAKTYEGLKQFQNSVSFCDKWIAIAKELDDKELEMNGYMHLGKIYFEMNRFDEAVYFSKLYLDFTLEMDEESSESIPYEVLMWGCHKLDRYDEAILYAKKCVGIAQKNCNKLVEMKANIVLKMTSTILNRSDDVVLYSKEIIRIARQVDHQIDDSHVYYEVCAAYEELKQYEDAILHYKKCCGIAEQTCDKILETEVCYGIAILYNELGQYDSAIVYVERCIAAANLIDDEVYQFKAYSLMGMILEKQCQYDDAILWANKCLDIAKQIESKWLKSLAFMLLETIYSKLEQYDEAISCGEKCLELLQDVDEKRSLDIITYFQLGMKNKALEKYETAIFYLKKCTEIPEVSPDDQRIKALAYLTLGEIFCSVKQYDDAVVYNKKCYELAKRNENIQTEFERRAFIELVNSYQFVDKKDDALLYGNKMLDSGKATVDRESEMRGHLLLAHTYKNLSCFGALSSSITEGMKIACEIKDDDTKKEFVELSFNLYAMVGTKEEVTKLEAPLSKNLTEIPTCSEEELLINLDQAKKTNNLYQKIILFVKSYNFYKSKLQFERGIKCLEELLELQLGNDWNIFCYREIGDAYKSMKQLDKALHYYEDKIPAARECNDKMQQSIFFTSVGLLNYQNKQFSLAAARVSEAIQYFELAFTALGTHDAFKISILDHYLHCYKLLSMALIKTNQTREALLVSDRCRARALRDLLTFTFGMKQDEINTGTQIQYSDVESILLSEEFSIMYFSEFCNGLIVFFIGGLQFLTTPIQFLVNDNQLRFTIDRAYEEMQVNNVRNCENRSLDTEGRQRPTSQKPELMLFQRTNNLCRLGGFDSREDSTDTNRGSGFISALQALYTIMIAHSLGEKDAIVIIPDGPLNMVPFAALQDPETGKYLSETKRIRLVPSLATLKLLTDLPMDLYSKKGALIIGDPAVGNVMLDGVERDFPPLEGARIEAMVIGSRLGVTPWMGKDATKSAVIQRLQQGVSVLHIAAHGSLSKATILLAPSEETRATKTIPEEEDYMLTMAEVQESQVRAQLVVLSCCHSGRGEIRAEGVVGMCRAFLASGAQAVVASLWAIDDDATLDFMSLFYYHLKNGKSASTSLQLTMNAMRKCESFKKPKYWAPFFLIGDDVTIQV